MGLTVYKPPDDKNKERAKIIFWAIYYVLVLIDMELGSSIGLWLRHGVWHW